MHNINFLDSVPSSHQQSLRSWYRITIGTFMLVFTTITFISTRQLYDLYTIKKQARIAQGKIEKFNPIIKQQKNLEKQVAPISKKADRFKNLALKAKQQCSLLNAICKTCTKSLTINSLQLSDVIEELTLFSPSIATATSYMEKLKKEYGITNLTIASLEPEAHNKNGYLIRINQSRKIKQQNP